MTASAFERFLSEMGLSGRQAAEALGTSPNTITAWRRGGTGRLAALACAALWHRLEPWG